MAGERVTLWTSAAAAGATFVAVAISAAVIWNAAGKQRAQFVTELATLNAKLDAANAKIDKTSATLADLKKSAAADLVKGDLTGLETRLASLAAGIEAKLAATDKSLAEIKTAKQQGNDTQATDNAARDKAIARLESTIGELKTGVADSVSSQNKRLEEIANSIVALKASVATQAAQVTKAVQAVQATVQKAGKDVAIARAPEPSAPEITSSIPVAQPLTVHFDYAGRANLAAQTNAIIGNLKTAMKGRHDCSISVAGHTDTLGRDDVNLDVSKERADAVAGKLKTAFAGQNVQIDSIGWGERRLKIWTPDGIANAANRRAEVSVDCKG